MILFKHYPAVRIQTNNYKQYLFTLRSKLIMFESGGYTQFKLIKLGKV